MDDRIAYAAPVNMVSAYMQGGSYCENAPGLRLGISNLDIAATFAPKPLLLISATGDWTSHVPREEYPAIKRIYDLYGASEKLTEHQVDAPHNYNQETRQHVYRFLDQQAFGRADDSKEKSAPIEKLGDMLALMNHPLPAHALDYDKSDWRTAVAAKCVMDTLEPLLAASEGMREALEMARPYLAECHKRDTSYYSTRVHQHQLEEALAAFDAATGKRSVAQL